MDWNWFFSSLSQSSAAIVGIFGAFIITKIMSNQAAFAEKNRRSKELIAGAHRIAEEVKTIDFGWYNTTSKNHQMDRVRSLLDTSEDAEDLYDVLNFSPYISRQHIVNGIQECIRVRAENFKLTEAHRPYSAKEFPLFESERLTRDGQLIGRLVSDARHQIRLISDLLDSMRNNPESSTVITYSLMLIVALFYVGVIVPLGFMPHPTGSEPQISFDQFLPIIGSIKGVFLISISAIVTVGLLALFKINAGLKFSESDRESLDGFTRLSAYSAYFAIMEQNIRSKIDRGSSEIT